MNRMIKSIGLIALAAVAMAALFAAAASASGTGTATVSAGSTSFTATQNGTNTFTLPNSRTLSCTTATLTSSSAIANNATTFEGVPNYDGCSAKAGESTLPVTVTEEDTCKWHFALAGGTEGATGEWKATSKLTCGTAITIRVYASEAAHTAGTVLCHYRMTTQTVGAGTRAWNWILNQFGITRSNVQIVFTKVSGTIANCGANGEAISLYNGQTHVTAASGTLAIH